MTKDEQIKGMANPNRGSTGVQEARPQRTWVGLMRGVRVEGDTVVITVKGGNDGARELCSDLLNEMEKNT
jgi:hypothetical protein